MYSKEGKIKRTMSNFIDVTDELIEEIGINNVTIRKVAEKAGYNSASIYNYFENLDHLIYFASLRNLKDYGMNLNTYLKKSRNAMDTFLLVWDCFCDHAYYKPEVYKALFFVELKNDSDHYIKEYYEMFPIEFGEHDPTISRMLLAGNIHDRGMKTINDCIKEGFITKEDGPLLNDMTMLIFESMLHKILRGDISYDDARNLTMTYYKAIVKSFLLRDYDFMNI